MGGSHSSHTTERIVQDPAQTKLIEEQSKMIKDLMNDLKDQNSEFRKQQERFMELMKELQQEREEIPPEKFAEKIQQLQDSFIEKIRTVDFSTVKLNLNDGLKHICVAGPTSAGKSTLINAIAQQEVCEVGLGETTMTINPIALKVNGFQFYDMPGCNDRISYMEFDTLSFFKAMSLIVIIYDNDPVNVCNLIRVCDALKLPFVALRNKCENARPQDDLQKWKVKDEQKILSYVKDPSLLRKVYFVSGRHKFENPNVASILDWDEFINYLVNFKD